MLNKLGIRNLANQLVSDPALYDQSTFGEPSPECGTTGCLAGPCLLAKIGEKSYARRASNSSSRFSSDCVKAGKTQLGLPLRGGVQLFESAAFWPFDLWMRYSRATTPKARAKVALLALQRLLPDGSIDVDQQAVHTSLKRQLNRLAAKKKTK